MLKNTLAALAAALAMVWAQGALADFDLSTPEIGCNSQYVAPTDTNIYIGAGQDASVRLFAAGETLAVNVHTCSGRTAATCTAVAAGAGLTGTAGSDQVSVPSAPYVRVEVTDPPALANTAKLVVCPTALGAGLGGASIRTSADCADEPAGVTGELCADTTLNAMFICESGPCESAGWVAYTGAAGDASTTSYTATEPTDWEDWIAVAEPTDVLEALDALSSWLSQWWTEEGIYHLWWYRLRYATDDEAFVAALDDCGRGVASGERGCTFVLPRTGAMIVTETIEVGGPSLSTLAKNGVRIVGAASGSRITAGDEHICGSLIDGSGVAAGRPVLRLIGVRGFELANFCITGGDVAGNLIEIRGNNGTETGGVGLSVPSQGGRLENLLLTNSVGSSVLLKGMGADSCAASSCTITAGASLTVTIDSPSAGLATIAGTDFTTPTDINAGDWIWVNGATVNDGYYEVAVDGDATDVVVYHRGLMTAITESTAVYTSEVDDQVDTITLSNIRCADVDTCVYQDSSQSVWTIIDQINAGSFYSYGIRVEAGSASITNALLTPASGGGATGSICFGRGSGEWRVATSAIEMKDGFGIGSCVESAVAGSGEERMRTIESVRFLAFDDNATGNHAIDYAGRGRLGVYNNHFDSNTSTPTPIRWRVDAGTAGTAIVEIDQHGNYGRRPGNVQFIFDFIGNVETTNPSGIIAGTATNKTLAWWKSGMGDLRVSDAILRRTLYFSAYTGNDSNEGTQIAPLRTIGTLKDNAQAYTRIVLKSGEVWSPNTYTLSSVAGSFLIGETVSDGAAYTGRVVGYHVGTQTMVLDDTASTISGSVTLTGATSGATGDTNSTTAKISSFGTGASDTINTLADPVYQDRVVLLITSDADANDPDSWPVIHANGEVLDGFYNTLDTSFGWLAVEKVKIIDNNGDTFGQTQLAKILLFNTQALEVRNVDGVDENNNAYTSHDDGAMIVVNSVGEGFATDASGAGSPYAMTGESNVLVANFECIVDTSFGQNNNCYRGTGGENTIINGTARVRNGGATVSGAMFLSANDEASVYRVAKVSLVGGSSATSSALRFDNNITPGFTNEVYGRQLTMTATARGIQMGTVFAGTTATVDIDGVLTDALTAATVYHSEAASAAKWPSVSIRGVWDDDDANPSFVIENVNRNAQADIVQPTGWDIFETGSFEAAAAQFGTTKGYRCAGSTLVCWEAYETPYYVDLPANLRGHIPIELTDGQQLYGFSLGGSRSHYGAH